MNWNALKVFLAVLRTGSLSGAAHELGVNHSTAFRQLKSLEEEIGGRLFDKIDNRYHITPVGVELESYAQSIADQFDAIERTVMGKDYTPKGLIRITAPFNIANRYLPPLLQRFQQHYPEITFEILSSNQEVNMNSRLADVAIRVSAAPPDYLVGRKIADISWGVYASPEYLKGAVPPVSLANLSEHRLIGGCGHMAGLPAFTCLEQKMSASIVLRCDELTAMSHFAEQGAGLAFLPLDQERVGLTRLFLFEPAGLSHLWALTHPDLRKTERIRLLLGFIYENLSDETFMGSQG